LNIPATITTSNHLQQPTTTKRSQPLTLPVHAGRPTMNSHAQGYGPYFHCIQGRLFLTVEVRSPPINPFPAIDSQENIEALIGDALSQCPPQEGPSAPPPIGAPPLASQPGLDLSLIGSESLIPPPNNPLMIDWLWVPSPLPVVDEASVLSQQLPLAADQPLPEPGSMPQNGALWDATPMTEPWTPIPNQGFSPPPTSPATVVPPNTSPAPDATARHTNMAASPFSCPLCPSGHNAKRTLHRHIWVYHRDYAREHNIPSENEECPFCHRIMRKDNLKRHVDKHHKRGLA
jgi:hypothetical protein